MTQDNIVALMNTCTTIDIEIFYISIGLFLRIVDVIRNSPYICVLSNTCLGQKRFVL